MPFRSQQQAKAMYAAASGHSTLGIPASVGQKFVAHAAPGGIKKLPKRIHKAAKPKPKGAGHYMSTFGALAPSDGEE